MRHRFSFLLVGLTALLLAAGPGRGNAQTLATRVYTLADGLPQSTVYALAQDARGQLWAGTQGGVGWFDGHRFQSLDTRHGLPDNHVTALLPGPDNAMRLGHYYGALSQVDADGKVRQLGPRAWRAQAAIQQLLPAAHGGLWVLTAGDGLYQLPGPAGGAVRHFTRAQGLPCDTLYQAAGGPGGQLWLATAGGLGVLDTVAGRVLSAPVMLRGHKRVYSVQRAVDKSYWLGLETGLGQLTPNGADWQLQVLGAGVGLCPGAVQRVLPDHLGRIWTLTAAGIGRYEPRTGRAECFPQPRLLTDQTGNSLLEDREGNLWTALDEGILQHIADERFSLFGAAAGLDGDGDVQNILAMGNGLYWVGTLSGLWELRPNAPAGQQLRPGHRRPGGSAANFVRSLFRDQQGRVWLGSRGGGVALYEPATQRWRELSIKALAGQKIRHFAQDRLGRVWAVTGGGGAVVILNPETGAARAYGATSALGTNDLWTAYQDRQGTLWLGSDDRGLIRVEPRADGSDEFRRAPGQPDRLSIGHISEDARGHLWLGSIGSGVLRYDGRQLHSYGPEVGLQSNNPYFAECDARGRVWVGTERGLEMFDPATRRTVRYGLAEGFLGQETNQNAILIEPDGNVWAGTVNGVMRYNPAGARPNRVPPHTRISGTRVFMQDTTLTDNFQLPYTLNHLTFDFVGVSLTNPAKVRYQYRLVGFEAEWSRPDATGFATYTNLPPGQYTFEVKAANNDGVWNAAPARLRFTIGAPWWRTWWAYALYALGVGAAFYFVRRHTQQRERERARRLLEYQALTHLREMDRVKTDFFTHISHELRTPLTLILGPAEELAQDTTAAEPVRHHGRRILGNARKLLHLINQLLDLSRLEAGGLALHPQSGDVAAAARGWLAAFQELAAARQIGLHLALPPAPVPLVFDAARLDEVVTNLLANALRFTPAGGHVTLAVRDEPETPETPGGAVIISVQDTGVGILAEHLPHLFDRFYQVPAPEATSTGSGVGLALVKELTERHGGTVQVLSTPGAGTTFVVRLPRNLMPGAAPTPPVMAEVTGPAIQFVAAPTEEENELEIPEVNQPDADAELILVVDDSAEVREFVQAALAAEGYRVITAASGPEAMRLALETVPSLVVSDVMMPPGFDGYELCRQLKTDVATSHVPVVLLTARAAPADRLAGLETGADAYLTKPFAPRELRAQVRNLLALRRRAPLHPESGEPAPPAAETGMPDSFRAYAAAVASLSSLDQCFLAKVEEAVERHLDNGDFSVEMLGEEVALSRAQLHRKLKALTGQAPSDFIRHLRLQRAHVLLAARVGSVSEVAYQVGFNSPAHFSTSFSKQFGYAPSEVLMVNREMVKQ